jgi:hypothetical protein
MKTIAHIIPAQLNQEQYISIQKYLFTPWISISEKKQDKYELILKAITALQISFVSLRTNLTISSKKEIWPDNEKLNSPMNFLFHRQSMIVVHLPTNDEDH